MLQQAALSGVSGKSVWSTGRILDYAASIGIALQQPSEAPRARAEMNAVRPHRSFGVARIVFVAFSASANRGRDPIDKHLGHRLMARRYTATRLSSRLWGTEITAGHAIG